VLSCCLRSNGVSLTYVLQCLHQYFGCHSGQHKVAVLDENRHTVDFQYSDMVNAFHATRSKEDQKHMQV